MKRTEITIVTELESKVTVSGWLFSCCALRLVAHKKHNCPDRWTVSEFSTGLAIPIMYVKNWLGAITTRKEAIACATQYLTHRQTSLTICKYVGLAIRDYGIKN